MPLRGATLRRKRLLRDDAGIATLTANGRTLGYDRTGAGPPLVLVNGFAATRQDWDPALLAALARDHELICLDNRGLGESPDDGLAFTVADLAADVREAIDVLGVDRPVVLGWSMGGYGALLLGARLGPARTAAICAVSPALWLSSGATAPGAFDGPEDFAANSVFGLPALGSIPIRIDCGTSDPFYGATKQFIAQLPNPPAGGFTPGGHDGSFWSAQLPAEIAWMAPLLAG